MRVDNSIGGQKKKIGTYIVWRVRWLEDENGTYGASGCCFLLYIRGVYDEFPDFFRMGTFIDCTHMKL